MAKRQRRYVAYWRAKSDGAVAIHEVHTSADDCNSALANAIEVWPEYAEYHTAHVATARDFYMMYPWLWRLWLRAEGEWRV